LSPPRLRMWGCAIASSGIVSIRDPITLIESTANEI
jgi:hypothetical protein